MCVCERDRQTDRQTDRQRQAETDAETETEAEKDRHRDTETQRGESERERESVGERETDREREREREKKDQFLLHFLRGAEIWLTSWSNSSVVFNLIGQADTQIKDGLIHILRTVWIGQPGSEGSGAKPPLTVPLIFNPP
jgi:hypothetical protein